MLDKRISESFDRKLREINCKSAGSILESVHTLNEEDLDEMALYGLQPEHDTRSSFYNKAIVDIDNTTGDKTLYSYHTPVAKISKSGELELLPKWNSSNTTLRHVKEFLRQNGFKADSLKQITKDYLSESVEEPDVASFVEEIKLAVDPEDIDTYESDLYVKVSPKVTEILKKYNMLDNPLLSKFIDEIDHEEWYEIPFGNLGKRIVKEELDEISENLNESEESKAEYKEKHINIPNDATKIRVKLIQPYFNKNGYFKLQNVNDEVELTRDPINNDYWSENYNTENELYAEIDLEDGRYFDVEILEKDSKLSKIFRDFSDAHQKKTQLEWVLYNYNTKGEHGISKATKENVSNVKKELNKYTTIYNKTKQILRNYGVTFKESLNNSFKKSLKEELDENTKKEVEVELEDILKRNPEEHGFDADTEEVKYYVVKLLKDKGYKTETSGNDNYNPNKYHVEYWKE